MLEYIWGTDVSALGHKLEIDPPVTAGSTERHPNNESDDGSGYSHSHAAPTRRNSRKPSFDLVLACDLVYDTSAVPPLLCTLHQLASSNPRAVLLVTIDKAIDRPAARAHSTARRRCAAVFLGPDHGRDWGRGRRVDPDVRRGYRGVRSRPALFLGKLTRSSDRPLQRAFV